MLPSIRGSYLASSIGQKGPSAGAPSSSLQSLRERLPGALADLPLQGPLRRRGLLDPSEPFWTLQSPCNACSH